MPAFEGIYTPLLTFFDTEGEVDYAAQARHVTRLVQAGVHGVVPLATMGEFTSLDRGERSRLAEAVIEEVSGRAQVIVGTGAPSTREAVSLSRDAEAAGADGVMVITPFYIKPDRAGLRHHYEAVRAAVEIPVMAYHLPSFTGVELPVDLILELAQEGVVQGVKDSSGDIVRALWTLDEKPADFAFLTGADPLLASTLFLGGQGGVVGSSNVVPELAVRLYQAVGRQEMREVADLQFRLYRFTRCLGVGAFPAAAKYLVGRVADLPTGCRPPVEALTKEERRRVDELAEPLLAGG